MVIYSIIEDLTAANKWWKKHPIVPSTEPSVNSAKKQTLLNLNSGGPNSEGEENQVNLLFYKTSDQKQPLQDSPKMMKENRQVLMSLFLNLWQDQFKGATRQVSAFDYLVCVEKALRSLLIN